MKKLLFGMAFFMGAMMFSIGDIQAGEEVPVESGFDCKVEILPCDLFLTSFRQICHKNGTGLSCICGESTSCD